MKPLYYLAALFTSTLVTQTALAFIPTLPEVSKIEDAQYYCGSTKGAVVLKVTEPPRLWQTDLNEQGTAIDGLEHSIKQFLRARCPHCYRVVSELALGDDKIEFVSTLSTDEFKNIKLSILMKNDTGRRQEIGPWTCRYQK